MSGVAWSPQRDLDSSRWREDTVVVNPFGERVWLRVCYDTLGHRIGITDCCPVDDPCNRHRAASPASNSPQGEGDTTRNPSSR